MIHANICKLARSNNHKAVPHGGVVYTVTHWCRSVKRPSFLPAQETFYGCLIHKTFPQQSYIYNSKQRPSFSCDNIERTGSPWWDLKVTALTVKLLTLQHFSGYDTASSSQSQIRWNTRNRLHKTSLKAEDAEKAPSFKAYTGRLSPLGNIKQMRKYGWVGDRVLEIGNSYRLPSPHPAFPSYYHNHEYKALPIICNMISILRAQIGFPCARLQVSSNKKFPNSHVHVNEADDRKNSSLQTENICSSPSDTVTQHTS